MEQKDIDRFQEKFPFLTGLNYGGKEHVGIVQNYNNQLTTIYDFDKLRSLFVPEPPSLKISKILFLLILSLSIFK